MWPFDRRVQTTIDTDTPASSADIELLVFTCAEARGSDTMEGTITDCAELLGVPHRVIDVWRHPEAVCRHRLILAPAVILLVGGEERARLVGPRSCRQIERFVAAQVGPARSPAGLAA